ncbi:hypothetical protein F5Y18DRAFT_429660 [Xylariaceae sp. FL1019]|nr:hypothetical protein F5Y18DRAFT_429660 [Xylariaceae sp. FL1019]
MGEEHPAKKAKVSSPKEWVDHKLAKLMRADEYAPFYHATLPSQQFVHQAAYQLREDLGPATKLPKLEKLSKRTLSKLRKNAVLKVKAQWEEQNIWKKCWDELILAPALDGVALLRYKPPPKDDVGEDRWEHEHSEDGVNSRPINMFLYQIQQRLRQAEMQPSEAKSNIGTTAYNAVLKNWRIWNIWDDEWGILPGLRWRHEGDFDAWALSVDPKPELYEIPTPPELKLPPGLKRQAMDEFTALAVTERLAAIKNYKDNVIAKRRGGKPPKDYSVVRLNKQYMEWRYK